MKTKSLLIAILVMSAAVVAVSCGGETKAKSENEGAGEEKTKSVKVVTLAEEEVSREIDYPANLVAYEEVYLAPSTPGRIIRVIPEIGDRVGRGQLVVQMDPTQLNNSVLQLASLEKDMARFDTLIQYGGVSKQQYDQIKTQYDVTKANVDLL
ncbi:MAG: efflux transporter periplasmic adaptor subunit, partial [Bacteroidales bacterium]|nr:efflux transporter periplasmic adaptor subunit [Bacteroidales bacterium]